MNARAKVYEILTSFQTAMLITHAPSGPLDARPMQIAALEDDGRIWFFTSQESRTSLELKHDARLLLVMQDDRRQYLCIYGTGRVLEDHAKAAQLWKEPYRVWFPKGVEDPALVLVCVTPEYGKYWETAGTEKATYLFEATRAYLAGEHPDGPEPDRHGRTAL